MNTLGEYSSADSDANLLISACETGSIHDLERCLLHCKEDTSFTAYVLDGNTYIHLAAKSGSAECVRLLLNRYNKADVKNKDMDTPLHLATKSGTLDIIEVLLEAGAKIFEKNRKQNTPVHVAAMMGNAEALKLLLRDSSNLISLVDLQINISNANRRTALHLAAQSGSSECVSILTDYKANPSLTDEYMNTALHYAALSGSWDCVSLMVGNGSNLLAINKEKCTALSLILNNIPNGETLMCRILDNCIDVVNVDQGIEELRVNLKVLCPAEERNKMAVPNRLYSSHRDKRELMLHPLLKTLVKMEWEKSKYVIWYRFFAYLLYLVFLTVYISSSPNTLLSAMTRIITGVLSVHVMLFSFPYILPGHYSYFRRISKAALTTIPPILVFVTVIIPYNPEWCGISLLCSWLSLPFYTSAISFISYQTGMFIYVTKEMCKHSLVFFYVIIGFSLTFFVLYHDKESEGFDNFGHAVLYTILILLQGDNLGDFPIFGNDTATNSTAATDDGYFSYVTEALSSLRFASITASLLFVLVVIITLLNMLIALAVRGGDELVDYGQIYHLWSQAQLLYEWNEVKRFLVKIFPCRRVDSYRPFNDRGFISIEERNISMSLRHELRTAAKNKTKRQENISLTLKDVERLLNDKVGRVLGDIEDIKQSIEMLLNSEKL